MTPQAPPRHRLAGAVIVALWLGAAAAFLVTAAQGPAAFHLGQAVSGLCIVAAGVMVAVDWLGVTTAMGQRRARRWGGRLIAPEASNPQVAARATRYLAWWWIGFGALLLLLALTGGR